MKFTYWTKDGKKHKKEIPDGKEYYEERLKFIDYLERSPKVKIWK